MTQSEDNKETLSHIFCVHSLHHALNRSKSGLMVLYRLLNCGKKSSYRKPQWLLLRLTLFTKFASIKSFHGVFWGLGNKGVNYLCLGEAFPEKTFQQEWRSVNVQCVGKFHTVPETKYRKQKKLGSLKAQWHKDLFYRLTQSKYSQVEPITYLYNNLRGPANSVFYEMAFI